MSVVQRISNHAVNKLIKHYQGLIIATKFLGYVGAPESHALNVSALEELLERRKKEQEDKRPIWGFDSPERLLCSAIWFPNFAGHREVVLRPKNIDRGIVLAGLGHAHAISQWAAITGQPINADPEHQQGFITSMNRFVDRREGARIAYEAGQVPTLKDTIYSECCLWSIEKDAA